jgi:type IV pilus assembly protein PilE
MPKVCHLHPSPAADRQAGFTLVELMVVVAISAVLAAVAYPAYTGYVLKSRRSDAIKVLGAIIQAQERYRSNSSTYADTFAKLNIDASTLTSYYDITMTSLVAGNTSFVGGYILNASTKTGSSQANDARCAQMIATFQRGDLVYSAKTSGGASNSDCWPR